MTEKQAKRLIADLAVMKRQLVQISAKIPKMVNRIKQRPINKTAPKPAPRLAPLNVSITPPATLADKIGKPNKKLRTIQ